jgi:CDP-diacylglycerol--glycerol-3-phosphate 3-phosphatidyltransferase
VPPTIGEPTATVDSAPPDRVLTIPNLLSLLRLLGVPLFLWLLLGPHADWAALGVLAFAGVSDWLDGKLARLLNQTSRVGMLLDPAADRLYILATLTAFSLRDIIPWWLAGLVVGRDLVLGGCLLVLRRYGYGPPQVHYLGKAATLNLLYAFPLLLLGARTGTLADIARPTGWAFTIWGTALYLWAGLLYLYQVARLVRDARGQQRQTTGAGTPEGQARDGGTPDGQVGDGGALEGQIRDRGGPDGGATEGRAAAG